MTLADIFLCDTLSQMKVEKKIQLLTAHAFDKKTVQNSGGSTCVCLQFYGRDEENHLIKINYYSFKPYFFIDLNADNNQSQFINFEGKPVHKIEFSSVENYRTEAKRYSKSYESDISAVERFLMDKKIFGSMKVVGEIREQVRNNQIFYELDAEHIEPVEFSGNFSIFSFDIETSKKNEVISIAYSYQFLEKTIERVWVLKKPSFHAKIKDGQQANDILFSWVNSEKELLENFIRDVSFLDPDFIIGWNVIGFDLKVLSSKCEQLKIPFTIGRDDKEIYLFEGLRRELRAKIPGRVILDGPRTLKLNFYQYESYKLNNVAKLVLGEVKDIDEDEIEDKWGEIERRYYEDPKSLALYNLKDAALVNDIFKKLSLIELLKKRVLISGLLFDKIGGSTAAFDHHYLPFIHEKGYVAPNILDIVGRGAASGGFVLEPVVGLHDDVVVFDYKSLYPTVISTFKIDPYSLLKRSVNPKKIPNGLCFSSTEYFLPTLIDELLVKRANAKKINDSNLSQSIKILMNSFYGVMGSFGCRFYHEELPQAITNTGQWVLKSTIQWIESQGYKVLYGDTDSIFVQMRNFHQINLNEFVAKINQFLDDEIFDKFQHRSKLEIQLDKKFKKLFLSPVRGGEVGAKKKYAGLQVKENNTTELLIVGMEFVRSDWSKVARKFQFELLNRFLNGEELEDYIKNFVSDLRSGKFKNELGMKKRLSRDANDYQKISPPHVQAAKLLENERGIKVNQIEFVMTKRGAVPIQLPHEDVDYEYYLEKQIKPLADGILIFQTKSFDGLIQGEQLSLF